MLVTLPEKNLILQCRKSEAILAALPDTHLDCPVCLDTIAKAKMFKTACNHDICKGCLGHMLKTKHALTTACPLCRADVVTGAAAQ